MRKFVFVVALLSGVFLFGVQDASIRLVPSTVSACDYCLLTQGLSPLETTRGLGIRIDGRYTVLNSLFSGHTQVENHQHEKETHFTTQITTFYNVTDRFTLIGVLPIPRRSVSVDEDETHGHEAEEGHQNAPVHRHSASGSALNVGDINVLARYTFLHHHTFEQTTLLALQLGAKMPTGSTQALDDEGGFLDAHIQPGTGSWNFIAGLSFNWVKNRFGINSNLLYSVNTTGEAGQDDYRFGNWLNADVTARYPIWSHSGRHLFLSIGLNGEFRGKEEINGQTIANTGGEVLYVTPGLRFMLSRTLVLETAVLYPFHHNLNGAEQLGEGFKGFFGINYLLN